MEITDEMLEAKKIWVSNRYSYETLEQLVEKYGNDAILECEDMGTHGDVDFRIVIRYQRMETKTEINERIKEMQRVEERKKRMEIQERLKYEELKKKYG